MKYLVIYDSRFGNTEKVAQTVAESLREEGESTLKHLPEVDTNTIKDYDVVVLGTPVHGGRPSEAMQQFLDALTAKQIKGIQATAFDTRFDVERQPWGLKMLMKSIGYAAEKMEKRLKNLGAEIVVPPKGFIVTGKEGPLLSGELEEAERWAKQIAKSSA